MEFWVVVCFMTGSPENPKGGLWKAVREELLRLARERKLPYPVKGFLTDALHFLDFNISKEQLQEWLSREFTEVYDVKAPLFVDSGGYKFKTSNIKTLVNTLKRTCFKINCESVFMLQMWYRADLVASLDFPILSTQSPTVRAARMRVNIENAIWLLKKIASLPQSERPIPVLVVHGQDVQEAKNYIAQLLNRILELSLDDLEIRFAVGTYSNNRIQQTVRVVSLLRMMVRDRLSIDPWIHVFGYAGREIWKLVNAGAASFDSNKYVVAAKYMKWVSPALDSVHFYDVTEEMLEGCGCPYCERILELGLRKVKRILKSKQLAFAGFVINGEKMYKYHLYALLAMHNLFAHCKFLSQAIRPSLLTYIQ